METSRFVEISDEELNEFIEGRQNPNTKKKTAYDVELFKRFIQTSTPGLLDSTSLHELSPQVLNDLLSKFIFGVRKKNGSEYEPTSLRGFLSSIQRYLNKQNYGFTIFTDAEFKTTMATLKAKQMDLKAKGFGNKPMTSDGLTDEEIEKLYASKCLGIESPQAVINTLWLNSTIHFGLRGGKEQRELCWGDVKLKQTPDGKEYLEYSVERQTKTRTGSDPRDTRKIKPRMYSAPDLPAERDPVRVYKFYASKRPESMKTDDSPFYLAVNNIQPSSLSVKPWYKLQPIGVNKLNSLLKDMVNEARLGQENKRLTNHSARKHLVQKLNDNEIPPTQIMQITGHRNVNSVNNYSSLSDKQKEKISGILSFRGQNDNQLQEPRASTSTTHLATEEYQCVRSPEGLRRPLTGLGSLISGTIGGGTFNINVNLQQNTSPGKRESTFESSKKWKLVKVVDSSDESQE